MEFIANSGAKVKINVAPFGAAMKLKSAIQKKYAETGIEIAGDFKELKLSELDLSIDKIAQLAMALDSSEEIYRALFDCLIRCTYNGEKITESTFEPVEAREDYYQIVIECLKVNFTPFLKGLASRLSGIAGSLVKNPDTQKQE